MKYTVKKLADMSGVSVRTLHYYDQINLLNPQDYQENGYREYGHDEALRLQQILFFRELGFGLESIKEIMDGPDFDLAAALLTHRDLLEAKIERIYELITTVDKTINKLNGDTTMKDDELYRGFDEKKQKEYEQEIAAKYGQKVVDQSNARVKDFTKADWDRVQDELKSIHDEISANWDKGPESPEVQVAIARHREWLTIFSTCDDERHLGLGEMYVADERFRENYKKFLGHEDGAEFMRDAIRHYCRKK